ncbi:MAG: acyl-CoA synthetase [Hyphomicrobiaceae bacterium]|nr:acyl-CoA synthetase [Hyphomicrobiaceae bacterium]
MPETPRGADDRAVLLDNVIGSAFPRLATADDVHAIERIPITERLAAGSTYDALRLAAARNPAALALQFLPSASHEDVPLAMTHGELFAQVTQAANMFHGLGIGPGDVVSFLLPLLPQSFLTLFGAEAAGIANPVNPLLEPHQIAEILEAAGTKVLVALGPTPGSDIWEKVVRIAPRLPHLKAIVQVGGRGDAETGVHAFDQLLAQQPGDRLLSGRAIAADDTAAYFHTGGTTGTPKLVVHSHLNQVFQAWACNLMLKAPPERNLLFGMPLFHVGGSLTQALATLAGGGCLVVLSPAGWRNPAAVKNLWRLVARYRPEVFSSVPTVLAAALSVPVGDADISSLRYCAGGGSAIPVAVGQAMQDSLGTPVLEVYGMTETSSVHTIAYMDRPIRLGSVGHPVPYARVRIVKLDDEGRLLGDCGPNEIGVVAMAGPGVFRGYLNEQHNRHAFVEPGWVNSGDLGRRDAEGYLWITGRAKDLVIRGGHNIDPAPIEEVLFQHPAVALAAVVGQPDAYAGELPIAYVQLKPGAQLAPGEIEAWTRERTPERAAVPVSVVVVDPMPLTAVGKVFKPRLRWDASQRVFRDALAGFQANGVEIDVAVGPHGTHGSLATVWVRGVAGEARAGLERTIRERLAPFVMRHEIVWL